MRTRRILRLLAARGAKAFGADFSHAALEVASRKAAMNGANANRANFIQADAQRLPFAAGSFDAVVSCETIEHLPIPNQVWRKWRAFAGRVDFFISPHPTTRTRLDFIIYTRAAESRRRLRAVTNLTTACSCFRRSGKWSAEPGGKSFERTARSISSRFGRGTIRFGGKLSSRTQLFGAV